jgi:hypothetical protein
MKSHNRVFGVLLLGFVLLAGCIQSDDSSSNSTPDVPGELPGENVSRSANGTGATDELPALQLQPTTNLRCGNCDPAEQCCNYVAGCFVVSPDGQHCV